jgi:endonuclease/exonuclease/phosphatase family metal-dependent hydrolase
VRSARRSLAAAAAAALLLASCGHYVNYPDPTGPRYQGSFATAPDPEPALRIVTFNIQHAREIERAIGLLREDEHLRSADIIFLQEMDDPGTERVAAALGMHYVYYPALVHPASGHDFGNAVLSRWPLRDAAKIVLPHRARIAGSQRIATACTVDIADTPVRLYSVHAALPLSVSSKGRREQMRAVIDDASRGPAHVIVAGDLNSHGLGRPYAEAGFTWASERIGSTERWFDVDHVFLRGFRLAGDGAIGSVRDNRKASDHRPVWAVLEFDGSGATPVGGPAAGQGRQAK